VRPPDRLRDLSLHVLTLGERLQGPKSVNYICPDGKTIAGPACVADAGGICGWTIVACPVKTAKGPCSCLPASNGRCVTAPSGICMCDNRIR
jgi:hypothetical protein